MNEWPRLFLLLALAGVVVTLLGSAAAWLMDEERRIRRALKRVLKGPAEAVIIARGRGNRELTLLYCSEALESLPCKRYGQRLMCLSTLSNLAIADGD